MNMKEGIYTLFQTLMAFFQGPALAILLPGIFWKRANGKGAAVGFVCGVQCPPCPRGMIRSTLTQGCEGKPSLQAKDVLFRLIDGDGL